MSYHLLGDFTTANSVLDTFRQSQVNVSVTSRRQHVATHQSFMLGHYFLGNLRLQAQRAAPISKPNPARVGGFRESIEAH